MARYSPMRLVDVPGQFEQGIRDRQRNKMAEMGIKQQETRMGQQEQINSMLGNMGNVKAGERTNYLANMASQGPQGVQAASQVQQMWQGMDNQQRQLFRQGLEEQARLLATAKDPASYQMARSQAIQMDPSFAEKIPEQYNPQWVEMQLNRVREIEDVVGQDEGPNIGTYNPRDYTTDSFAEFAKSGDPSVLERFGSQRNVDIGGVPHRFDPVKGGYFPAVVGGQPQGAGPQGRGATQGAGRQPAATQKGRAVTPETVGESRATIAQMEAERTPPKGMRFNDQGRLVPIEGSPEQREMQRTRQKSKEILDRRVPGVLRDITRAMEEADQAGPIAGSFARTNPEAGRLTRASAAMSPAYELNQHLDSIKSNISLEELQSMREASPTGGALGQVPVRQQEYLMQIQGSLNPELPPETLRENLSRVGNNYAEMYLDALYGDEAEWEQAIEDGRATPEQAQIMLQEKEKMAKETLRDTGFDQFGRRESGEPAKPSSQQEYDALPSGAIFIDPDDGKRYRKP